MVTTNISFRIEEGKRDQLDQIATSIDRDRSWVINEAIENYIELHEWQLDEIRQGMADTDAGRTVSLDQARKRMNSVTANLKKRSGGRGKPPSAK